MLLLLMNFICFIWTSALLLFFHSCSIHVLSFLDPFSSLILPSFLILSSLLFSFSFSHFHFLDFFSFFFSHVVEAFKPLVAIVFRMQSASPANILLVIVIMFGLSRHVLDIVLSPLWAKADIIM